MAPGFISTPILETIPAKVIGRPTGLVGQGLNECLLLGPNWAVAQTGLA